MMTMYT